MRLIVYHLDSIIIGEILVSIELIKHGCSTERAIFAKQATEEVEVIFAKRAFTEHCILS